MRSGSIGLSHLYCAAFTHFLCVDDLKKQSEAAEPGTNGQDAVMLELGRIAGGVIAELDHQP